MPHQEIPTGCVRVAAPLAVSDDAVRLAVVGKLHRLSGSGLGFRRSIGNRNARWSAARATTFLGGAIACAWWSTKVRQSRAADTTTLELQVRPGTNATERERVLQRWYRQHLRDAVPPLIAKWQACLGVQITGWGIKKMKTKWGACSAGARRIWLNLELAKKPVQCLEYLIVQKPLSLHRAASQ